MSQSRNKEFTLKTFTKNPDKLQNKLRNQLKAYNVSQIEDYQKKQVLFAYYKNKKLIAGLYGYQSLGMFYIDLLWVDPNFQRQKLGSDLLNLAEKFAVKNKALYIRVNTASFQAPKFYLKNNYELFAKLPLALDSKKRKKQEYDYYFVKYLKIK